MNFTERILKNVENVGRLVYLFHAQSSAAEQGNAMLARVPRHAPAERPQRKMAHQLHKNELTLMHRATPRRVPRSRCATATRCSNRDQENTRLSVTCSTLKRPVPINVGRLVHRGILRSYFCASSLYSYASAIARSAFRDQPWRRRPRPNKNCPLRMRWASSMPAIVMAASTHGVA
jgi:hypothetical protein